MAKHYVYTHYRADGSPFYIGKSTGLRRAYRLKRNEWHQRVVEKDGAENIRVEVIECRSNEQALALEMWLIRLARKLDITLTNLTDGGDGVRNPTPETRHKIGSANRGKSRPITDAHKAKIGAAHKGMKRSEKAKENMRASHAGQALSAEHREKIGHASKKIWDARSTETKLAIAEKQINSWTAERKAAKSAQMKKYHSLRRESLP